MGGSDEPIVLREMAPQKALAAFALPGDKPARVREGCTSAEVVVLLNEERLVALSREDSSVLWETKLDAKMEDYGHQLLGDQWEAKVEEPSRLLVGQTMKWLSSGWAAGNRGSDLGGVSMFCAASWCAAVNPLTGSLFGCVFALLPLVAFWPLARFSHKCNDLLDELNAKGLRHLECHDRLFTLEWRLRQLNQGQGMGIRSRLFGVLNLPKLQLIFTGVASLVGTDAIGLVIGGVPEGANQTAAP